MLLTSKSYLNYTFKISKHLRSDNVRMPTSSYSQLYELFIDQVIGLSPEVLNVKKVVIKIAQNILKFGQPISKY